jgi:hypothetical protein
MPSRPENSALYMPPTVGVLLVAAWLSACQGGSESHDGIVAESLPLTVAPTAPSAAPPTNDPFDQSRLCVYADNAEAGRCQDGEIAFFRPNRWGNEQLPLTMAALYCDFRHPILFNNGGCVCTFSSLRAPAPKAPRGAQ